MRSFAFVTYLYSEALTALTSPRAFLVWREGEDILRVLEGRNLLLLDPVVELAWLSLSCRSSSCSSGSQMELQDMSMSVSNEYVRSMIGADLNCNLLKMKVMVAAVQYFFFAKMSGCLLESIALLL